MGELIALLRFRKLLVLGCLWIACQYSFGQNQIVADSLKQVLESDQNISGKELYGLLWEIADNETIPEKGLLYCTRLLSVAQQMEDNLRIASAYELLHFAYRDLGNLEKANQYYLQAQEHFLKNTLREKH